MPPPVKTFGERLADALVEDGLLTPKQVEDLLEQQRKEGTRLLKLVVEKTSISDVDMTVAMGRVLGTPPVNVSRLSIPGELSALIPKEVALNHKVLPVSRLENRLWLAMADPLNVLALDDVKRITKLDVVPMIASEKSIIDKLNNLDTKTGTLQEIIDEANKEIEAEAVEHVQEGMDKLSVEQLQDSTNEAPVSWRI